MRGRRPESASDRAGAGLPEVSGAGVEGVVAHGQGGLGPVDRPVRGTARTYWPPSSWNWFRRRRISRPRAQLRGLVPGAVALDVGQPLAGVPAAVNLGSRERSPGLPETMSLQRDPAPSRGASSQPRVPLAFRLETGVQALEPRPGSRTLGAGTDCHRPGSTGVPACRLQAQLFGSKLTAFGPFLALSLCLTLSGHHSGSSIATRA